MISSIRLQRFRSYANASFEFEPGVNIIVGPNASGKTNLLEAVMVLTRGSSYRARDAELVQFNRAWARLDGNFDGTERSVKLEHADELLSKSFVIGGQSYKRLNLERSVPVVFFEPNHLNLFSRGPEARREYFDELLERTQPGFKSLNSSFRRTLAQRNSLLKKGSHYAADQLFAWDVRLSEQADQIAKARHGLIEQINKNLARVYGQIAGRRTKVRAEYTTQFAIANYGSKMLAYLQKHQTTDFERGFTGAGPHREDFVFYLSGQPASATASRGEARSLLLSLKSLEIGLIEQARDQKPILLLDDVFSELDGKRRHALVEALAGHQSIITTTDADSVLAYFETGRQLIALI